MKSPPPPKVRPFVKVEVAGPETWRVPSNVDVPVFVTVRLVRVVLPAPRFVAKRKVDVALVVVAFANVAFWNVDWFATPVPVAVIVVKAPMRPVKKLEK
jgi:hypothetical protein